MTLDELKPGDWIETTQPVDENMAASHLGSGSLRVYATPAMITLIEHTCRKLIEPHLPQGQTSVGVEIHARHLAPTPTGSTVSIRAEILTIEGPLVTFKAYVRDEIEAIGEAEHTRALIDIDRFLRRVEKKSNTINQS
jgi:fluoroacetyl-CoA thioesterase